MKTKAGRWTLRATCLGVAVFSLWAWLRPYEWKPDPAAQAVVKGVELKRDRSYHWVTVRVRSTSEGGFDVMRPVYLRLAGGRKLSPADTRLAGSMETGFREAWYQFWLEEADTAGPWRLEVRNGTLAVKSADSLPVLKHGEAKHFTSHHW